MTTVSQLTNGDVRRAAQVRGASAGLKDQHGGGPSRAIHRNIGRYAAANLCVEHGPAAREIEAIQRPEIAVGRSRQIAGRKIVHVQRIDAAASRVRSPGRRADRVHIHHAVQRGDFDPIRVTRNGQEERHFIRPVAGNQGVEGANRDHPHTAFVLKGRVELVAGQCRVSHEEIAAVIEAYGVGDQNRAAVDLFE